MTLTQENIEAALDFVRNLIKEIDLYEQIHGINLDSLMFAGKTFVAGGFVRDKVMGLTSHDIDLVVEKENGGIELAKVIGEKIGREPVVYERFGTAMISLRGVVHNGLSLDGIDIECVHTRKETYTPGSRKPETTFGTLMDDVMRRDLTINSLVMDIMTGAILDLTGRGFIDILNKTIDTTGDADEIFREDPLRMIRAVRFLAHFDGKFGRGKGQLRSKSKIDDSIKKNAHLVLHLSKERIREELEKIFNKTNWGSWRILRLLKDLGLLEYILHPVLLNYGWNFRDVGHAKDIEEKFAIIFSCMPKDELQTFVTNLKFSNKSIDKIVKVAHAFNISRDEEVNEWVSSSHILKAAVALTESGFSRSIHIMTSGDSLFESDAEIDKHHAIRSKLREVPKIYFDAAFLMNHFNKKPGKWIGELIDLQRESWFQDPWINKDRSFAIIEESLRELCVHCGR